MARDQGGGLSVQSEYSLWTHDQEQILPLLRERGIGLVAYSPLGHGFLTGAIRSAADIERLDDSDFRKNNPRLYGEGSLWSSAFSAFMELWFASSSSLRIAYVEPQAMPIWTLYRGYVVKPFFSSQSATAL